MIHILHTIHTVELGDYAQVHEFDAEVIAVDRIAETCTLEFVNDQGDDETVEVPLSWLVFGMDAQQKHEFLISYS